MKKKRQQASKSKRRNSRMWKIKNKKNQKKKKKKKEKYFQGIVIPLSAFVTCSFSPSIRIITKTQKNPKLKWQKQKWLLMGGGDFYCVFFWGIWWTPTNETDDDDGDPRFFFCSRARRGRKIQRDLVGARVESRMIRWVVESLCCVIGEEEWGDWSYKWIPPKPKVQEIPVIHPQLAQSSDPVKTLTGRFPRLISHQWDWTHKSRPISQN